MAKASTIVFTQKLTETAMRRCAKHYNKDTGKAINVDMLHEYAKLCGLDNFDSADFDFFVSQMTKMDTITRYKK